MTGIDNPSWAHYAALASLHVFTWYKTFLESGLGDISLKKRILCYSKTMIPYQPGGHGGRA